MTQGTAARPSPRSWVAIIVALLLWASAFAGIRAGLQSFSPGALALLRFGTASLVLGVYALIARMRLPDRRDLPVVITAGFVGITVYHVALNYGEVTVSAGAAALIIAAVPIFTAILSAMFLGERLTGWGWGGIVLAFVGVAAISFGQGAGVHFDPNALVILIAALASAVYFILAKKPLERYSALEFTSYAIWAGTVPMLVFAPQLVAQMPAASTSSILAGVYMGIFPGAIAYVLWSYALARMSASVVSAFLYFQPVNAAVIAWVWLGEIPTLITVVGGTVAIVGVVIVNTLGLPGAKEHPRVPEESAETGL